jgi:hypothetical protein
VPKPDPTDHHPGSPPPDPSKSSTRQAVLRTAPRRTRTFIDDSTSEHHQCHPDRRRARGVRAP